MTIPERSCGFCRRLLATTIPVQQRTLPEEGYDAASYLVGYGGNGHAYALHLHCFKVMCIEVLCYHEVDMRRIISIYLRSIPSFIIRGVLSNSCMEVVHLFYIMSLFSLWKLCWINNLIMNLLFIIMTSILLWLNWCLIKWMTCLDSLLAEIYSHPIMFFRCLIWMLWLKRGN